MVFYQFSPRILIFKALRIRHIFHYYTPVRYAELITIGEGYTLYVLVYLTLILTELTLWRQVWHQLFCCCCCCYVANIALRWHEVSKTAWSKGGKSPDLKRLHSNKFCISYICSTLCRKNIVFSVCTGLILKCYAGKYFERHDEQIKMHFSWAVI